MFYTTIGKIVVLVENFDPRNIRLFSPVFDTSSSYPLTARNIFFHSAVWKMFSNFPAIIKWNPAINNTVIDYLQS